MVAVILLALNVAATAQTTCTTSAAGGVCALKLRTFQTSPSQDASAQVLQYSVQKKTLNYFLIEAGDHTYSCYMLDGKMQLGAFWEQVQTSPDAEISISWDGNGRCTNVAANLKEPNELVASAR